MSPLAQPVVAQPVVAQPVLDLVLAEQTSDIVPRRPKLVRVTEAQRRATGRSHPARRRLPAPVTLGLTYLTIALVSVSGWLVAVLLGAVACDTGACGFATLSHRPLLTLYLTGTAAVWLLVMAWGTELFTLASGPERLLILAGSLVGLTAAGAALAVTAMLVAVVSATCGAAVGLVWLLVFR